MKSFSFFCAVTYLINNFISSGKQGASKNRFGNFEAFLLNMSDKYIPINCEFLERLELWSLQKTNCNIIYQQGNFPRNIEINAIISDIICRNKADFLILDSGDEIRLDRIISVNSYELPKNSCRIG